MRAMNLGDENTLTADKLFMTMARYNLGGLTLIQSPFIEPEPVLQLDPKFEWCTAEFRSKMNAWLRERFGVRDVAYMYGRNVLVNPRAAAKLVGDIRPS